MGSPYATLDIIAHLGGERQLVHIQALHDIILSCRVLALSIAWASPSSWAA